MRFLFERFQFIIVALGRQFNPSFSKQFFSVFVVANSDGVTSHETLVILAFTCGGSAFASSFLLVNAVLLNVFLVHRCRMFVFLEQAVFRFRRVGSSVRQDICLCPSRSYLEAHACVRAGDTYQVLPWASQTCPGSVALCGLDQ